ncbi:IS481-like element IS1649 family transposase [Serinicoccus chungangensis]
MSHANAALTPRARLRVARLVVDQHVPVVEVAARFQCSWPTVKRCATRYAAGESMIDCPRRPWSMPAKTCPATTKRIVSLRLRKRIGPVQLAAAVGVAPSTAHRVLVRCRLNRLSHVDRATGEPVRRYEHEHPGDLLHVDVKKFGNIPDGGGWRFVGREQGRRNRSATPDKPKNRPYNPKMGHAFVHTVVDDHSRGLRRGPQRRDRGHRGRCPGPGRGLVRRPWHHRPPSPLGQRLALCFPPVSRHMHRAGHQALPHRPRRPQTNGKVERFHRTLADGWGYARCYTSENERRQALPRWLHEYNHHRPHTACGNQPPITRLTNLSDQYT